MTNKPSWLYGVAYCVAAGIVGSIVGAVAGVGIAGMVLRPEEAVVLYTGVGYGVPAGALAGILLGIVTMLRRNRMNRG